MRYLVGGVTADWRWFAVLSRSPQISRHKTGEVTRPRRAGGSAFQGQGGPSPAPRGRLRQGRVSCALYRPTYANQLIGQAMETAAVIN